MIFPRSAEDHSERILNDATNLEQLSHSMKPVKVDVIINSGSGADDKADIEHRLHKMFAAHGLDARILVASSGEELTELVQGAAHGDADTIVAGGGDGTISLVAAAVLDSNKTLGVLPFGTMNHFAKDLRMPLELEPAIKTIAEGVAIHVDVGEVNGQVFINNSSLGLYPSIVREREKQQRLGRGKWPAFVWAALAVLRRYPFLDVRLTVGGQELRTRTPFVFIGNNEYEMETLDIGGRAALDRGALSLYVTNRISRLGLIRLMLRAIFGGLRQEKDFLSMTTEEVWIETKHKRLRVARDGEITVMQPPLHYRIRKQALRVLVARIDQTSKGGQ